MVCVAVSEPQQFRLVTAQTLLAAALARTLSACVLCLGYFQLAQTKLLHCELSWCVHDIACVCSGGEQEGAKSAAILHLYS